MDGTDRQHRDDSAMPRGWNERRVAREAERLVAEAEAVAADARAGGSGSSRYLAWWVLCGAGWVAGTFGLFAGIDALAWPGIVAHVVALGALMGDGSDATSGGRRSGL